MTALLLNGNESLLMVRFHAWHILVEVCSTTGWDYCITDIFTQLRSSKIGARCMGFSGIFW